MPETRLQSILDTHDEQIHQLQSDVLEIKASLQNLEAERDAQAQFRAFINWVNQQGKTPIQNSPPILNTPSILEKGEGSGVTNDMFQPLLQTPLHQTPPVVQNPFHHHSEPLHWTAKKITLPEFLGFDPQGWISKAKLYFEIHSTTPHLWVRLVQLSMVGVAQHWFTIVKEVYLDLTWEQLTPELLQRFSGLEIQNPYEQLLTIHQGDSILDYIDDLEYLLSLVPRLPETQSLGYFIAGLRPEVKRWVRLHRPETRLQAMCLAKDVEAMLTPGDESLAN